MNISLDQITDTYNEISARQNVVIAERHTLDAYLAMDRAEQRTTPGFLDRKLRSQERLSNALVRLSEVIFRYNLAIADFHRAKGTLLRYNNVKLGQATALE